MNTSSTLLGTVGIPISSRVTDWRLLLIVRTTFLAGLVLFVTGSLLGMSLGYQLDLVTLIPILSQANFGIPPQSLVNVLFAVEEISVFVFLIGGLFIFWRRSDDWVALLIAFAVMFIGSQLSKSFNGLFIQSAVLQLVLTLLLSAGYLAIYLCYCFFPDGRFSPRWLGWLVVPCYAAGITFAFFYVYSITAMNWPIRDSMYLVLVAVWGAGTIAQVQRYRRATSSIQRQQTKWAVLGAGIAMLGVSVDAVLRVVIFPTGGPIIAYYTFFGRPIIFFGSQVIFVVLIIFAILRYRLWNVDLVINRGLVLTGVTFILAIVFVTGFLGLQFAFSAVLGGQQTTAAVAVSAAVIAGLFNPTRHRVQHIVDRRFFGLRVDLNQLEVTHRKQRVNLPSSPAASDWQLGPYEVQELLGRGGMGEVYKGRHRILDRTIAIKILSADHAAMLEFQSRFEREAKIMAGLRHLNIVTVFDYGYTPEMYYLVMEYIDGQNVASYLKEHGPLPVTRALPIIRDVANALDYLHEQGFVHRDVKPSNVMLQKGTATNYRALLMDFGLTKLAGSSFGPTQSGAMGTLDYMAPEQIRSAKLVDRRADIYALGIMTFQILTGNVPFKRDNLAQILFAHLHQPAPDPCELRPELPVSIGRAILCALAKNPEDRFSSAGAFVAALA